MTLPCWQWTKYELRSDCRNTLYTRTYVLYRLLTGLFMGDDDSLTHVSGHVIIAVTSLCCGCRAEIERRDGNFFMLRFQLGANPWLTYCLVVVVELRCVYVTYRRPSWNNFRFLLSLDQSQAQPQPQPNLATHSLAHEWPPQAVKWLSN